MELDGSDIATDRDQCLGFSESFAFYSAATLAEVRRIPRPAAGANEPPDVHVDPLAGDRELTRWTIGIAQGLQIAVPARGPGRGCAEGLRGSGAGGDLGPRRAQRMRRGSSPYCARLPLIPDLNHALQKQVYMRTLTLQSQSS